MKIVPQNKAILTLCAAAPILLATAVSAGRNDDYQPAPSPSPSPASRTDDSYDSPTEIYPETPGPVIEDTPAPYTEETPAPFNEDKTSAPTDYYVETTEEGEMEEIPSGTMQSDDQEREPAPMNSTENEASSSSSCSTYDEDVQVATLLAETCEWNTYMCCWTGHDGGNSSTFGNADVCRVLDYLEEGDVLELPRDAEGAVYCHGFGWSDGADAASNILPLYNYVKNFGRTDDGGYYGNVDGAPECGCIEDMPVVSDAACTRHGIDGFQECNGNSLRSQYRGRLGSPNGDMDSNLVRACDNEDVPDYDFRTCDLNTYMCCWTENDGQGMKDNTDVCRVGNVEYPGESEGEVHCHGFVWPEDATDKYIHLLAQFVQHFDHRDRRGYYGNLPDAPMCGCVEDMPEVSEADCTTYDDAVGREGKFTACTNNDLLTRYLEEYPTGDMPNLVDECDNEVSS